MNPVMSTVKTGIIVMAGRFSYKNLWIIIKLRILNILCMWFACCHCHTVFVCCMFTCMHAGGVSLTLRLRLECLIKTDEVVGMSDRGDECPISPTEFDSKIKFGLEKKLRLPDASTTALPKMLVKELPCHVL